jgi:hypothetical protein
MFMDHVSHMIKITYIVRTRLRLRVFFFKKKECITRLSLKDKIAFVTGAGRFTCSTYKKKIIFANPIQPGFDNVEPERLHRIRVFYFPEEEKRLLQSIPFPWTTDDRSGVPRQVLCLS